MSKPVFQFSTQYETPLQIEFHELLTAFETLQNEHEALLTAYAEIAERNKAGKQYLTEQTERLEQLNSDIKTYNDQQQNAKNILQNRAEEARRSTELLEQSANTITKQKEQINSLTNILESLNSEHQHDLKKRQDQLERHWQAKIDKKQAEIDQLTAELAKAKEWQNIYKDEIEKERQIKAQFKEQNSILNEQNAKLSTQITTLRSQNSEQASNHNTLTGLIAKFKTVFNLT